MLWNQKVREILLLIWQRDCSAAPANWFAMQTGLRMSDLGGAGVEWGGGDAVECGCDCTGYRYVRFAGQRGVAAG